MAQRRFAIRSLSLQQLIGLSFTACVLVLAITSSLVISQQSGETVQRRLQDEGMQLVSSLASQSTLALLYGDTESATQAAARFLAFPDVRSVELMNTEGLRIYASQGAAPAASASGGAPHSPALTGSDADTWTFEAPVWSGNTEGASPFAEASSNDKRELLGSVRLVMSRQTLSSMRAEIVRSSLGMAVLLSAVMLLVLLALTSRLTVPIRQLAAIMRRAQDGAQDERATLSGTREIVAMQNAFNAMMGVLQSREEAIAEARDRAIEQGVALDQALRSAIELAKAKDEFASTVSHELRTPLNGVIGMLDLVSDMELGTKQNEYVRTARSSADMLLSLINDILTFSKVEKDKEELEIVPFDPRERMEDVLALVTPQAQAKDLDLACVVDENIPAQIQGDMHHLGQVLCNLLGNAIKFTEQGSVGLSVSLVEEDGKWLRLRFEVTDTGIGIEAAAQKRIFEPFSQADSSTTRRFGGTGLGLSISRELVRLMGGEISVDSTPGRGSCFHFELRVMRAEGDTLGNRSSLPLAQVASVLVCDDNALVRRSIASMLIGERVRLTATGTLEATLGALEHAAGQERFDIAIIDEGMVSGSTQALAAALAAGARHVVRLAVRPRPEGAWLPGIRTAQVLTKPVRRIMLHDCIRSLLAEQPAARALNRSPASAPRDTFAGTRVLVVEDNRANQEVAIGMLERLGCEAVVAADGLECLDKLREQRFDLILMDCHMPRMDGFEATRRIREMNAAFSAVPVVAMTANVQKSAMEQCQAAGMNDYLSKPIKLGVLREALGRWLTQEETAPAAASVPATLSQRNGSNTVVDKAFLDDLRQQIGEAADRMVGLFLEDLPGYIEELRTAAEAQDMAGISRVAHTLKGASGNVGANRLAQRALALEQEARSGVRSGCDNLVSALVYEANLVRHVLEGSTTARPSTGAERNPPATRQSRILVVDDDRSSRFALRETLLSEGHEVLEAGNGQQAVEICRQAAPDLIVMDGMMPVMDGFSACTLIRSLPGCAAIPILLVTGMNDEGAVDKAFGAGATDYIAKPINYAVLRRRIEHLLAARSAEERVHQLAYVDSLTGRPNRTKFNEHMEALLLETARSEKQFALLFLDINDFKLVNDTLGHEAGDLLLKYVAERLVGCVRKGDFVARFGGDEFCIVLDNVRSYEMIRNIAEKIHDHVNRPFVLLGREMLLGSSIGIAVYPEHGTDAGTLLRSADMAMYHAKTGKKLWEFYEPRLESESLARLETENELRNAIDREELVVYYQPQEDLRTGLISGYEALIRWQHPTRGLVPPAEFIELAERNGLINEIGRWVLCTICEQMRDWAERGFEMPRVAINLSARQLANPSLVEDFREVITDAGIPPDRIEFEITESAIMERPDEMIGMLRDLKAMGTRLAVDDFGTGYSSLSYLKRFPLDYIKIDRAFISDVMTNRIDADIVRTIIALAQALEVEVIAEGVETTLQRQFLKEMQCHYLQGFLLSKPVPAEDIERLFLRRSPSARLVQFPRA